MLAAWATGMAPRRQEIPCALMAWATGDVNAKCLEHEEDKPQPYFGRRRDNDDRHARTHSWSFLVGPYGNLVPCLLRPPIGPAATHAAGPV
jgi:hypothetical protein